MAEYENKMAQLSQEYEKLTVAYRTKTEEGVKLESQFKNYDMESTRKLTSLEQILSQRQRDREDLARKLQESERKSAELESRLARASQ